MENGYVKAKDEAAYVVLIKFESFGYNRNESVRPYAIKTLYIWRSNINDNNNNLSIYTKRLASYHCLCTFNGCNTLYVQN